MLLIMAVNLIVVRELLKILGASDYGLYNVVGGCVTMFAFLNNALASASQRYFSFEIVRHDLSRLQDVYSSIILVYIVLCLVIILLGETIGLWFVINHLKYEEIRYDTVFWTYQFSLFSLVLTVFSSCYNAIIIAYEKMKIFTYISLFEACLKLLSVYLLFYIPNDKVITYAGLLFITNIIITFFYRTFSRKYCKEVAFSFIFDKKLLMELIGFSSWNLIGSISGVLRSQGINILLNVFFGTLINAARGISYQVYGALHNFSNNFYLAVKPQIIKLYSVGDKDRLFSLLFYSTKASYFLLLVLSFPVIFNLRFLLECWLTTFPPETIHFTCIVIINLLIESLSNPLMVLAQATGNVKDYQMITGGVLLLNIPISFFSFYFGSSAVVCFYIMLGINILAMFIRLIILKRIAGLNVHEYIRTVLFRITIASLLSYFFINFLLSAFNFKGIIMLIISIFSSILIIGIIGFYCGLNTQERTQIIIILKNKLSNEKNIIYRRFKKCQ